MQRTKSANDKFKDAFRKKVILAFIVATFLHVSLFVLWQSPLQEIASTPFVEREVELVPPPDVAIPSAPKAIPKPSAPQVAKVEVDEDITIEPTTFEENPIEELPPPPSVNDPERPTFIPKSVDPYIKNRAEVLQRLRESYPDSFQRAKIGGRVLVDLKVSKTGEVLEAKLKKSSGYKELDNAALNVVNTILFTPALNRDKKQDAWVRVPIVFKVE